MGSLRQGRSGLRREQRAREVVASRASPVGRRIALAVAIAGGAGVAGCATSNFQPPPPSGTTYVYSHQGYREKGATVVAGHMGGPGFGMAYGGVFAFRGGSDIHARPDADPFAQSTPIDGVRFNEHLGAYGIGLAPASAASTPTSTPTSSASPSPTPTSTPTPTPTSSSPVPRP